MAVSLIFFVSGIIISSIYAHQQHINFVRDNQYRVNRKIVYCGYCGKLALSDDCHTYTCTFVGRQSTGAYFIKAKPEEQWDSTGSTETDALEGFYSHVDSLSGRPRLTDFYNEYTKVLNNAEKLGCPGASSLLYDLNKIMVSGNDARCDRLSNCHQRIDVLF